MYDNERDIKSYDCDFYILNMILVTKTGIQCAYEIRKVNSKAIIVFLTDRLEYCLDAFKVNAFRCLYKPIETNRIMFMLDDVYKLLDTYTLKVIDEHNMERNICLLDVLYIECYGRMSKVYFKKRELIVKRKVIEWVHLLDEAIYVKAYKGLIVNLKNVSAIDDNSIILNNGEKIFVSKYCKRNLHKKYSEFVDALVSN